MVTNECFGQDSDPCTSRHTLSLPLVLMLVPFFTHFWAAYTISIFNSPTYFLLFRALFSPRTHWEGLIKSLSSSSSVFSKSVAVPGNAPRIAPEMGQGWRAKGFLHLSCRGWSPGSRCILYKVKKQKVSSASGHHQDKHVTLCFSSGGSSGQMVLLSPSGVCGSESEVRLGPHATLAISARGFRIPKCYLWPLGLNFNTYILK